MRKEIISFAVFISSSLFVNAQTPVDSTVKGKRDIVVCFDLGNLPEFKGKGGFQGYIKENIKYPAQEKKDSIEGTVYIGFVIEADGSVTNVVELKGVPGGPGLTAEAIRVISAMPKWKPAMEDGKPIRTEMKQPVRYRLTDKAEQNGYIYYGPQLPEDSLGSIFNFTETMPIAPEGFQSSIIKKALVDQKPECAGGKVYISFILLENGTLVNIQLKGMDACPLLQQSILKAVSESPAWTPGKFKSNPVKTRITIPLNLY